MTLPLAQANTPLTLVSGTVLSSGQAVSRAAVTMTAWPVNTARLAAGATVPTLKSAVVTTFCGGKYPLSPDLSAVPVAYREPDGTVNVDIESTSGDYIQSLSVPVAIAGTPSAAASSRNAGTKNALVGCSRCRVAGRAENSR